MEAYGRTDDHKATKLALEANKLQRELCEAQPLDKDGPWEGSIRGKFELLQVSMQIVERREKAFKAQIAFNGGIVKAMADGHFDGLRIEWSTEWIPNEGVWACWSFSGIVWQGRLDAECKKWIRTDPVDQPLLFDRGQVQLELRH